MPIQILPEEVASQIAAGEVVERPASAVKELLENAYDALASQVMIRVEGAGKKLIEVADDGAGISPEELRLAVARHATSKLQSAQDLFHIATLGFRGEALASIGSVARLSITSRQKEASVGARIVVEAGKIAAVEEVGAPAGTVVRVEDLFYNVPARLKFLKQDATERRQIDGLVTRYAVAYPSVRIHLFQDGRPVLLTSGNGERREVLSNLYGVAEARQMLEILLDEEDIRISGFVSPVALTRSHRREITFFVNGRWVQDNSLSAALLKGYQNMLMVGRYPVAVLFIEMEPELVDVNVHPAKAEVRFREPERIFGTVQRAVRRGLLAFSPVPGLEPPAWRTAFQSNLDLESKFPRQGWEERPGHPPDWPAAAADEDTAGSSSQAMQSSVSQSAGDQSSEPQPALPSGVLPLLRLVGQVGNTYLVAEGPDGLYLIDQHAAHERVLFERMRAQQSGRIPSQALLAPVTIQLNPASAHLLTEQLSLLENIGFQVEPFGPNTFRVSAVPAILSGVDPVAAVRVVVEDFEEDETPLQAEMDARLVARICKRAAVKGGQSLSGEEQRALLRDLEACVSPRTCPHGRPTMIHLSVDLLERQFGRRGSR